MSSRWPRVVVQHYISKVSVSQSEESLQPDPGPAHHLHAGLATPILNSVHHPSSMRRVLPEPAQPGEQQQTWSVGQRRPGPRHQGQRDSRQQGELVQWDHPVHAEELCQHGWQVRYFVFFYWERKSNLFVALHRNNFTPSMTSSRTWAKLKRWFLSF